MSNDPIEKVDGLLVEKDGRVYFFPEDVLAQYQLNQEVGGAVMSRLEELSAEVSGFDFNRFSTDAFQDKVSMSPTIRPIRAFKALVPRNIGTFAGDDDPTVEIG